MFPRIFHTFHGLRCFDQTVHESCVQNHQQSPWEESKFHQDDVWPDVVPEVSVLGLGWSTFLYDVLVRVVIVSINYKYRQIDTSHRDD